MLLDTFLPLFICKKNCKIVKSKNCKNCKKHNILLLLSAQMAFSKMIFLARVLLYPPLKTLKELAWVSGESALPLALPIL